MITAELRKVAGSGAMQGLAVWCASTFGNMLCVLTTQLGVFGDQRELTLWRERFWKSKDCDVRQQALLFVGLFVCLFV